jgi:hypothetical protein
VRRVTRVGLGARSKRRMRRILVGFALAVGAGGLVVWSSQADADGFAFRAELLMNLGAGLLMTLATYVVLNPLFRELRTATMAERPYLDRDALIDSFAKSRSIIALLETWTDMLEPPYRNRFLDALRAAMGRGTVVRVLLLNPDSDGAKLRAHELNYRRDVQLSILNNLRVLQEVSDSVRDASRGSLQVRLYTASPSIQMYRWDDVASISFFPLDQSNFSSPQIEAYMTTPLGEFVERRFDELWSASMTKDLREILTVRLSIVRSGTTGVERCEARFVEVGGLLYAGDQVLTRLSSLHGVANLTVAVEDESGTEVLHDLEHYEHIDNEVRARVVTLFKAKYGADRGATDALLVFALRPRVINGLGEGMAVAVPEQR